MTQTRTDHQCRASIDACKLNEQFDGERPSVRVGPNEIICTTEELRGPNTDLLSLRAAVRRVLEAEDKWFALDERFWTTRTGASDCSEAVALMREARSALRAEMAGIDKEMNDGR